MELVSVPVPIPGVKNFVSIGQHESPSADEVALFACAHFAFRVDEDGTEMFFVKLADETGWCGMNFFTLEAGLVR